MRVETFSRKLLGLKDRQVLQSYIVAMQDPTPIIKGSRKCFTLQAAFRTCGCRK